MPPSARWSPELIDVAKLIEVLGERGHSPAEIAAIVRACAAPVPVYDKEDAKPLSMKPSAVRMRRKRAKKCDESDASPGVTVTDVSEVDSVTIGAQASQIASPEPSRVHTQVVNPSLPSLRSEEVVIPFSEPTVPHSPAPKSRKRKAYDAEFEQFWDAYPRHVAKQDAAKSFCRVMSRPHPPPLEMILRGARRVAAEVAAGRELQFVKHPATWLNGGCWEDDPLPPTGEKSNGFNRPDPIDRRIATLYEPMARGAAQALADYQRRRVRWDS